LGGGHSDAGSIPATSTIFGNPLREGAACFEQPAGVPALLSSVFVQEIPLQPIVTL